ncbi:MAG: SGNH/GDSL hydrolase family protein [Pseudomonadales bacterium]|nr:SGNH/GDSL hydrolase family protein [Pseudomonadales bacterium]
MKKTVSIASAILTTLLQACSWQLHMPVAEQDIGNANDSWQVHCETAKSHSPHFEEPPGVHHHNWLWAIDDEGQPIKLQGQLVDGFFQLNASTSSPPISRKFLRQRCMQTISQLDSGDSLVLGRVRAARQDESIDTPIIFPNRENTEAAVSRIVVFGDSLSDTGNLKQRLHVFPAAPYWLGRFSNGPIWIDYMEAFTRLSIQNHAHGGAFTVKHDAIPGEGIINRIKESGQLFVSGSLQLQVNDYIELSLQNGQLQHSDETAFVIWAGANDYISKEPVTGVIDTFLNSPEGASGYQPIVNETIAGLSQIVEKLYAAGGRRFVLLSLPDLGRTPIVLQNESYMQKSENRTDKERRVNLSKKMTELTRFHNQSLQRAVDRLQLKYTDASVFVVESGSFIKHIVSGSTPDNPSASFDYGFDFISNRETVDSGVSCVAIQQKCYSGGYLGSDNHDDICPDQDRVFFWDIVHPTSFAHCWQSYMLAHEMAENNWIAPVPDIQAYKLWCEKVSHRSWGVEGSTWILSKQ